MSLKLNVLLGKVEHLGSSYKASIKDYIHFFTKNQGAFRGIRKTYSPRPDTMDVPGERESKVITTTVGEKLDWLVETNKDYIDGLFIVEATNASGTATANLTVDGMNFGDLTSLELLRLISLLEAGDVEEMYKNLPVRSDSENWNETIDELYENRTGVYEMPKVVGTRKSITKEQYILKDPNIDTSSPATLSKYTPVVSQRDTVIELGEYTVQHFSGEASQRERAEILRRRTKLLVAAKEALKKANEATVVPSEMTSKKLFDYLHTGNIDNQ